MFEKNVNYILVGLRRSGKSTLLYKIAKDLVEEGCDWSQIIYVNFEDDRLLGFSKEDFNDIIETAHQMKCYAGRRLPAGYKWGNKTGCRSFCRYQKEDIMHGRRT